MFEAHAEKNFTVIKVSESEKIIISDNEFIIEGNINNAGIKFAEHIDQCLFDYQSQPKFYIGKLHVNGYLEKNSQKIKITWDGKPSDDWIKFRDVFERYFNLKAFL